MLTPPRPKCQPKVVRNLSPDFRINPDPDVYQIAPKMLWIHCLVSISHFAKFRKDRPVTVWVMVINLLKLRSDPESTCRSGSTLITSRGSPFAHAYRVWSTSVTVIVSYPAHRQNDRQTEWLIITVIVSYPTHRQNDRQTEWLIITVIVSYPAHRQNDRQTEWLITVLHQHWTNNNTKAKEMQLNMLSINTSH